ncbi:hypothetical protein [Micromonospora rubida]
MPFGDSTDGSVSASVSLMHLPTQVEYSLPKLEGSIFMEQATEAQLKTAYQALVDMVDAHPDWTVQATYVRGAYHPITPTPVTP